MLCPLLRMAAGGGGGECDSEVALNTVITAVEQQTLFFSFFFYLIGDEISRDDHVRLFYGCSIIGFGCPATTVATVTSRALDRVRERALGRFARSPKSPPARRHVVSSTCHRVP